MLISNLPVALIFFPTYIDYKYIFQDCSKPVISRDKLQGITTSEEHYRSDTQFNNSHSEAIQHNNSHSGPIQHRNSDSGPIQHRNSHSGPIQHRNSNSGPIQHNMQSRVTVFDHNIINFNINPVGGGDDDSDNEDCLFICEKSKFVLGLVHFLVKCCL